MWLQLLLLAGVDGETVAWDEAKGVATEWLDAEFECWADDGVGGFGFGIDSEGVALDAPFFHHSAGRIDCLGCHVGVESEAFHAIGNGAEPGAFESGKRVDSDAVGVAGNRVAFGISTATRCEGCNSNGE